MLFSDQCCQSDFLEVTGDMASLPSNFVDRATSISPCGNYRSIRPKTINETWLGHSETMRLAAEDEFTAIYYNDFVSGEALESHREYMKRVWAHVKANYGEFGTEGSRIAAFMHSNVSGPPYNFNSINIYFDITSDCRNLIDVVGGAGGWSKNLTGLEMDIFTHEISHIVEGASKQTAGSPSYGFWKDSKWAEIFIYDVYSALNLIGERDRWFEQMQSSQDNFPREGTFWFKNWFYPIYTNHGGVKLLNNYFETLAKHFPRGQNAWQYVDRPVNLGEFVHFFSGAAGKDLLYQAKIAFKWDDDAQRELDQAKVDFPDVQYTS